MRTPISIGLIGTTDASIVAALAPRIERLGFHTLWLNDVPGGDSLAGLRIAAGSTERLGLATGVIPLDRRPAPTLDLTGIPSDRLRLGIGSGRAEHPLALVADGITVLREATDAEIIVGALGPRMRRLAAERADGALLNWLTPHAAAATTAELHETGGARRARSVLYVRTIAEADARAELEAEAERYEHAPAYAANFARLGIRAIDATIDGARDLGGYDSAVDEIVLRAITPSGSLGELERFVETTAAWVERSA
ncbi:alkanesulfonate monooxygenase SsuD/methylene tetrahydromethanopterin reductase-like flavin-dependent oxidoreductase (luciferase family) [Agromyces hippuratus]|uniref:Alkanesulfonate monooxygenase SsuD/methylene tetrahydromethanopterin reductase-like flavin-dependent oxidoreductase (Luciferase family) n=1 Tax=Agromyces hippuratus TaxID=286438 RepID=A0A852WZJ0_9MICO|nr:LLM class flavin-dependent oxidoreductase [Agromyces hippuratus]NYG21343.1 alkanesulfonate monooxygenase SsuD/methylene tetrahydromethanopterin reductase-like flavin-dependent oxidoreductase (luciferase family) [Agromyces hippuratus]